jgi:hypothetical protein
LGASTVHARADAIRGQRIKSWLSGAWKEGGVMAIEMLQRVSDWFEQRKQFRAAALTALRKREGLPLPVDCDGNELETRFDDQGRAHYYRADGKRVDEVLFASAGRDGKPGAFAIGQRKGGARELADARWNSPDGGGFEILEVAEDGRKLTDELRDLDRDATGMEIAGRVDHGVAGEQAPGLVLNGTSDDEIDEVLQKFLKEGIDRHE